MLLLLLSIDNHQFTISSSINWFHIFFSLLLASDASQWYLEATYQIIILVYKDDSQRSQQEEQAKVIGNSIPKKEAFWEESRGKVDGEAWGKVVTSIPTRYSKTRIVETWQSK